MRLRGKTDRMEVVLDTDTGTVMVTQRWKCSFLTFGRHQGRWTEGEKTTFRRRICRVIDEVWGNKAYVYLLPGEDNKFNQLYNGKTFIIKVKIEFVDYLEDWNAKIYKARPGDLSDWDAWVDWGAKEIHMTSHAVTEYQNDKLIGSQEPGSRYWIAAHEFGHMLGYVGEHADEYVPGNPHLRDTLSIMNIGSEVRQRHYRAICDVLHSMCPGSAFGFRML